MGFLQFKTMAIIIPHTLNKLFPWLDLNTTFNFSHYLVQEDHLAPKKTKLNKKIRISKVVFLFFNCSIWLHLATRTDRSHSRQWRAAGSGDHKMSIIVCIVGKPLTRVIILSYNTPPNTIKSASLRMIFVLVPRLTHQNNVRDFKYL